MKLAKFVVLLAALVGLGGFFLPMVTLDVKDLQGKQYVDETFSPLEIVKGIQQAKKVVRSAGEAGSKVEGEIGEVSAELRDNANALGNLGMIAAITPFVPSLLLLILFFIALATRYGRGLASVVLLTGLIPIGIYFFARSLVAGADETVLLEGHAWTLIFSGAGVGAVAGVLGLAKPEAG